MSTVTQRIKEVKQPRGGYIKPSQMKSVQLNDNKQLNEDENIHPALIGLVVDYLTRYMESKDKVNSFRISLIGAIAAKSFGMAEAEYAAQFLLDNIKGLDNISIAAACKICTFDVWYRNPAAAFQAKNYKDIEPDMPTIENIRTMVNRSIDFYNKYGPVIKDGLTFEPNGYTDTVTNGDGDFLTSDTLWDFKVSKAEPTNKYTLQLAMYYIMGKHSGQDIYKDTRNIGIYNPRLNKVYTLDMNTVPSEVIAEIEKEVIGY